MHNINKSAVRPGSDYRESNPAMTRAGEQDFDLDTTLTDLYNRYLLKSGDNAIELVNGSGKSPYTVIIRTDKARLVEALSNLLDNAVRFTRGGMIRFGYSVCGSSIIFFVYDTGTGIPYECQPKVFNRFYTVENPNGGNSDSAGLGLAICKSNVELMGGRIWLRSEPGKWTIFFFTIPFKALEACDVDFRKQEDGLD